MKVNDILKETPLPASWEKSRYKTNTSFASRIRYASERATQIGSGSARVAFELEYEGRPTVLKIAKNRKGMAQNEFEVQMLSYHDFSDILIPMIDHDTDNETDLEYNATWLHVEKAEKMKKAQFKKFFSGLDPTELVIFAMFFSNKHDLVAKAERYPWKPDPEKTKNLVVDDEIENPNIKSFVYLVSNNDQIEPMDFMALGNWGVYKNEPVIIDIGLSLEVFKLHYARK